MATFTVHEPPDAPASQLDRADLLVFVRDGFTATAASVPALWMLANRLWLAFGTYVVAMGGMVLILRSAGVGGRSIFWVISAIHLIIGFEASTIRRWSLDRTGWRMLASVTGRNIKDCERRFFEAWLDGKPTASLAMPADREPTAGRPASTLGARLQGLTGGWGRS